MNSNKVKAVRSLKSLADETGCDTATAKDEVDFLSEHLTSDEIYSVVRLLEHALLLTHNVRHLPNAQARRAIKDNIKG